jgi:hypothetical protein
VNALRSLNGVLLHVMNEWLQLGLFINESNMSLHSAVDPNFSFVICDTCYAFFFCVQLSKCFASGLLSYRVA